MGKLNRAWAGGLAGLLLVASVLGWLRLREPAPGPRSAGRQQELQALVDRWRAQTEAPGLVVGISLPEQEGWLVSSGVSDQAANTPMQPADRFEIASITKTFIAAEVLKLSEQGLVTLDAPLATYLADVPHGDRITLRQLLSHRSGYFDPIYDDPAFIPELARNMDKRWTWEATLAGTFQRELYFEPGSAFRYSNANYLLLGLIIQKVTGRPLGDVLQADFFQPLALPDTLFITPEHTPASSGVVRGYATHPLTQQRVDITQLPTTALYSVSTDRIVSNAPDLLRWARALYGATPTAISPGLQAQMLTFDELGPYGLGVFRWETAAGEAFGHGGITAGYKSLLRYFPELDLALVILTNTDAPAADLDGLLDRILELLFPPAAPSNVEQWIADLSSADPLTRRQAITALGQSGAGRQALPQLIVLLQSDASAENRKEAALALGMAGQQSPEARAALEQAVHDPDPGVRDAARMALDVIGN